MQKYSFFFFSEFAGCSREFFFWDKIKCSNVILLLGVGQCQLGGRVWNIDRVDDGGIDIISARNQEIPKARTLRQPLHQGGSGVCCRRKEAAHQGHNQWRFRWVFYWWKESATATNYVGAYQPIQVYTQNAYLSSYPPFFFFNEPISL